VPHRLAKQGSRGVRPVLVTYRRSGQSVPTPVSFGLKEGKVSVRSEAAAAKVRRIRNDPSVRIARCTVRGKPLRVGPGAV
jgi:uncharacterized protein